MSEPQRVCTRCIMDTTDSAIEFDANGVCNHCHRYEELSRRLLHHGKEGEESLQRAVAAIKEEGKGKRYDCIVGVSGGVDSTYVAYLAKQHGLRPLAVHMDNGWDSELAVANIERVLKYLDIDLYTIVLDWEEFKDLQLAFLKASVPDAEIPTDHAIAAVVYDVAVKNGIRHLISGSNFTTEGVLPTTWTYGIGDWRYIKGVYARHGQRRRLRQFPHYSLSRLYWYTGVKRLQSLRILNYIDYNKQAAMDVLQNTLGWKYYGGKHYESIYTRFFQGWILPVKFNIDKRKAHLSSLILSGQITRCEALEQMKVNPYTEQMQNEDRTYAIKKFGITEREFDDIMALPIRSHHEYPNSENLLRQVRGGIQMAKKLHLLPKNLDPPL